MSKAIPLIVEPYPEDYTGYKFITLIRYNDADSLNIVDNIINGNIITYVLDMCQPCNVNEEMIIESANDWFCNYKSLYPISIHFSKNGLSEETSKIIRAFPIDYIARVIGPLPQYKMSGAYKIRKRKKKEVPNGIEIIRKKISREF